MNLFIVDDNYQFREAIKIFLEQLLKHKVVGEAENGLDFLSKYEYNNDIVLMDLNMPELNGYDAIKKAFADDTRIKAIALTMDRDLANLKNLVEMGFCGCVFKSNVTKKLPLALKEVSNGNLYFPSDIDLNQNQII